MHILTKDEARRGEAIGRRYACVTVRVIKRRPRVLEVKPGSVGVLRSDAIMAALPADITIVGPEGELIEPMGQFLISTESFDPMHALCDWNGEARR